GSGSDLRIRCWALPWDMLRRAVPAGKPGWKYSIEDFGSRSAGAGRSFSEMQRRRLAFFEAQGAQIAAIGFADSGVYAIEAAAVHGHDPAFPGGIDAGCGGMAHHHVAATMVIQHFAQFGFPRRRWPQGEFAVPLGPVAPQHDVL